MTRGKGKRERGDAKGESRDRKYFCWGLGFLGKDCARVGSGVKAQIRFPEL